MVVLLVCNTAISISIVGRPTRQDRKVVWVLLITLPAELWLTSTEKNNNKTNKQGRKKHMKTNAYGSFSHPMVLIIVKLQPNYEI